MDLPQYSSICSLGWRPLLLTGFLLEWMRHHFSDAGQIEDSDLTNTLWKADATTNLLVESVTRWKPELTEKRPAIIVKRNDIQNERQVIDDRAMGAIGDVMYATWLKGSHTLFCIAKEGAEAEKLATEVYRELIEFGPVVRQMMQLHKFVLQGIGAVIRLQEAKESFAVPVTVAYAFQETWAIKHSAPMFKKIDLKFFQP